MITAHQLAKECGVKTRSLNSAAKSLGFPIRKPRGVNLGTRTPRVYSEREARILRERNWKMPHRVMLRGQWYETLSDALRAVGTLQGRQAVGRRLRQGQRFDHALAAVKGSVKHQRRLTDES